MDDGSSNEWEPYVTEEMEENREIIQDKFSKLANDSRNDVRMGYSAVLEEFNYRTQKLEEQDLDSVSELIREFIPFIITTASVIESHSKSILIFYIVREDKIYDDQIFLLFNGLTQGERGQLLDKLDLLPSQLSNDMIKFNKLRNVVVHEYQSHYLPEESKLDNDEFGDALLSGVRSVQGLSGVMDMIAPDVAFK